MIYLGIDPGKTGGIAVIEDVEGGAAVSLEPMPLDPFETWQRIKAIPTYVGAAVAVIEKPFVHAGGRMGPQSAFNFGGSFFTLRAFLIAAGIPFEEVPPQHWMTAMQCMTGGDKNVSKRRAAELFPGLHITHATADALLIAAFCRQSGIVSRPAIPAGR